MKTFVKFLLLVILSQSIGAKLRLLSIVFRHGDRTPLTQGNEGYPNDPYANESFYPIGSGGLTKAGKEREYQLGQFLRQTYGDFLSPVYYPEELDARSTYINRARMSLELVLAGLYPPKDDQRWDQNVNWQPILTWFVPHIDDAMLFPQECPRFLEYLSRAIDTPEYQAKISKFGPLMHNLTIATGKNISNSVDMSHLYYGLSTASSMNLKLPQWANGLLPYGQLYYGCLLDYNLCSYNDDLKRVNGGMLLRKITDDMTAACNGTLDEKRKLFLYSGHDYNIVAVLQALGVYKPHVPRFAAAVVLELHEVNRNCLVKVKYYKGIVDKNESIYEECKVPGCNTGHLDELKNVLRNHIASDDDINSCNKLLVPEFLKMHKNIPTGLTDSIVLAVHEEKKKNQGKYWFQMFKTMNAVNKLEANYYVIYFLLGVTIFSINLMISTHF